MLRSGSLLAAMVLAFLFQASPALACSNSARTSIEISSPSFERALVCLINQKRSDHSLARLSRDSRLAQAARDHSSAMNEQNFFSHSSKNGDDPIDRIEKAGYSFKGDWSAGEIIGWGSGALANPQRIVHNWMHSSPHRRQILSKSFTELGAGVSYGTPDPKAGEIGAAATVDFAVP